MQISLVGHFSLKNSKPYLACARYLIIVPYEYVSIIIYQLQTPKHELRSQTQTYTPFNKNMESTMAQRNQ